MKLLHERLNDLFYGCLPIGSLPLSDGKSLCLWNYEAKALLDEIERDYITKEQHEREIRETVEAQRGGECGSGYSAHHVMRTYAFALGMPMQKNESITKWLDRWFIKRPCFEDGEPMHLGDMCDFGDHFDADERVKEIFGLHYVNDGSWYVQPVNESRRFFAESCKRPAPKMLDANGVEINVGDIVRIAPEYADKLGNQPLCGVEREDYLEVMEIDHQHPSYSSKCVQLYNKRNQIRAYALPEYLIHEEPDSLEKLLERMESYAQKNEGYVDGSKVGNFAKELRALIEGGA